MLRLVGTIGLALALVLWATPSVAQGVTMPKVTHEVPVTYPRSAIDEGYFQRVEVILELVVDATGTVTNAKVDTPRGYGFDEAAVTAARQLQFAPAQKNGTPVAARIKFKYVFDPPPAQLAGRVFDRDTGKPLAGATIEVVTSDGAVQRTESAADGRWSFPALPPGPAKLTVSADALEPISRDATLARAERVDVTTRLGAAPEVTPPETAKPKVLEVTVHGEKPAPAVSSLTRAEVRQLPGAFGDPFRAIESLPGVTPIISGLPFFYIRGAPPGNVGYFLDGVRVPYLYHIAIGPSVVQPAMVDRVDLYPGGYPARFGRYAGGIVSAETTEPLAKLHGEGNIRVFDAGAMVEGGFADGRGTVLLGGRYSYTAKIISLLAPDVTIDYRDYQARVSYDVTSRDRLTLFAFGSYDLLGQTTIGIFRVLFGSEFYRGNLRYEHRLNDGMVRTDVTLGFDQTRVADQQNVQDRSLDVKSELHKRLSSKSQWRLGTQATLDHYTADKAAYADPEDPDTIAFNNRFPPRSDLALSAWTDFVLDVAPGIEVTPGLRFDLYTSGSSTLPAFDPRIAARFAVSDKVHIVHAYGLVHQPPAFVVPVPGLTPGNLQGGLQSALQSSAGVEVDLPEATTAKVTAFENAFFNMSDALGTASGRGGIQRDTRSLGSAVGVELYLHRRLTKRFGGYLSYTLSRSTRSLGNESFPSAFDRTHVASGALAYDLGRRWRAGSRVVFYTGAPKTSSTGGLIRGPRSSSPERDPSFYRIDLRLEKRWYLTKTAWLAFVAEMLNATLHKEVFRGTEIGPVSIPSVGLEGGF
ncbi:MAG: TonB family protein [Polyangiaceae bacterium]|nr:TonB family protein [Polyangiaceae bacterium]